MDYGLPIRFGCFITPDATSPLRALELATVVDDLGFDLIGVQDHPYQRRFHDTWIGAYKPRMLALVGRKADGWVPSLGNLKPADIAEVSANELATLALEHGFDTFVVGEQRVQEFAADIAPKVRELIDAERGSR